jgi:hypothetical protein
MLAKAMSTAHHRNTSLGMAPSLIARQYVFERVSFRTSFKSASVNWPANCMFVVILIDGLRPVFYAKSYTQGEQSSSVERFAPGKRAYRELTHYQASTYVDGKLRRML